jgi:hypothetical protein
VIAHYTRALIADLKRTGTAEVSFGHNGLTQVKARSRLHNAASRAGLRISTTVEYDDREGRTGAVIARVTQ